MSASNAGDLGWRPQFDPWGQEDPLEKEMVTHSIILAWRIPWMEKPGRLQSTGLQRVGHDCVTSLSLTILRSQDCFGYLRFFGISIQIVKLFVLVL